MNHDQLPSSPAPNHGEPTSGQIDDDTIPTLTPAAADTEQEQRATGVGATGVGAEAEADVGDNGASQSRSRSRSQRRRRKKSKKDRSPGLVKRLSFVTHLLKSLDLLVFAELSGLYYMEFVYASLTKLHGLLSAITRPQLY
jgi:hypothetical protein